jgi:hypothetical protein
MASFVFTGNILGEATDLLGNNLLEAMRHHAACHHDLEQLAQEAALAKPTVAVLREGRMVGNLDVEAQPAEPTVGQIEVDLVA